MLGAELWGGEIRWPGRLPYLNARTPHPEEQERASGRKLGWEASCWRLSGPQVRRPGGQAASPEGGPADGVGSQG